jgi:predicted component of type VI protein secretion system
VTKKATPVPQAISVAGVTDAHSLVADRVVVAARLPGWDLLAGEAVATIEAVVGVAVAAIEPPRRGQQDFDRLGREYSHAIDGTAIEQHPPDTGQAAGGNPEPALGSEHRAIVAGPP